MIKMIREKPLFLMPLLLVLTLWGCASHVQYVRIPISGAQTADSDKARIYVVRKQVMSVMQKAFIFDGKEFVGAIGPRGYMTWETDPGKIWITGSMLGGKADTELVDTQAGKTYYFKYYLRPVFGDDGSSEIERYESEAEALKDISKCKPAKYKKPTEKQKQRKPNKW